MTWPPFLIACTNRLDAAWNCRGSLLPDPRYDPVQCIFMAVMDDDEVAQNLDFTTRILVFDDASPSARDGLAEGIQVPPPPPLPDE